MINMSNLGLTACAILYIQVMYRMGDVLISAIAPDVFNVRIMDYAYAYHIIHTKCYNMWYTTNHDIKCYNILLTYLHET